MLQVGPSRSTFGRHVAQVGPALAKSPQRRPNSDTIWPTKASNDSMNTRGSDSRVGLERVRGVLPEGAMPECHV